MKISVFGAGYVGLVTGACLANLGHEVVCVDIDSQKISQLQMGKIPFYEPGLSDLVFSNKEKKRLFFTNSPQNAIVFGDIIFNCVGTPGKEDGSADLRAVFAVAESVATFAQEYKVLVNKSTVPPGTAKKCDDLIKARKPQSEIAVVSNPEFLAEGKAVYDFTHPDKIVVGAGTSRAFEALRKVYTGRVRTYIPIVETDWETAELIKYANNAFLATKISFVNEIANICDKVGADVKIVAQAMGLDYRIGPKYLHAGVGYGGSCFPKDVRALSKVAEERGYSASLLHEVDALNKRQRILFMEKIKKRFPDLSGKTVTVWGLSFKPKTNDIREAPSLEIVRSLLAAGAHVCVCDPVAIPEVQLLLGAEFQDQAQFQRQLQYCSSLQESVKGSSAIVLMTEWDEFRNVNFSVLGQEMKERVIFDGRNIYEPELVKEDGFEYYGVGRR